MASSVKNNGIARAKESAEQSGITLKDGESLVGPTRRPDGTLRKPIRIRAGYVSQEEVAIYRPKRTLASLDRATNSENSADAVEKESDSRDPSPDSRSLDSAVSEFSKLNLLATVAVSESLANTVEGSNADTATATAGVYMYKKIRAIKKKIRLAEAKLQNVSTENMKVEQLEKVKKLENWREELRLLEGTNTTPLYLHHHPNCSVVDDCNAVERALL